MLIIKCKPLSLNSAYPTNRSGRRFLTAEGKAYKAAIAIKAREAFPALTGTTKTLRFMFEVSGPMLTKKGEPSQTVGDIDGWIKLFLDAVCDGLAIKDHLVWEISAAKKNAPEWMTCAILEEI